MQKICSLHQFILEIQSNLESCVRLATLIFDLNTETFFDQFLIYVNFVSSYKKNSLIRSRDMAENILAHISGTKIFPNMGFEQEHNK